MTIIRRPPPLNVKITRGFYLGIYEFTQRQYELITGTRPSYFSNDACYAKRPVENVLGNKQVGGTNLAQGQFMGVFRSLTGYEFRLPTEAEWEYAARAGTRTVWNNGTGFNGNEGYGDENLKTLGRYAYNNGNQGSSPDVDDTKGTASVGSYIPNAWGLYDMHGNVCEMCQDFWKDNMTDHWTGPDETTGVWTDPGFLRYDNVDWQVRRGGNYNDIAKANLLTRRQSYLGYDWQNSKTGFRIACTVED